VLPSSPFLVSSQVHCLLLSALSRLEPVSSFASHHLYSTDWCW
jgi:hypothetical protein